MTPDVPDVAEMVKTLEESERHLEAMIEINPSDRGLKLNLAGVRKALAKRRAVFRAMLRDHDRAIAARLRRGGEDVV